MSEWKITHILQKTRRSSSCSTITIIVCDTTGCVCGQWKCRKSCLILTRDLTNSLNNSYLDNIDKYKFHCFIALCLIAMYVLWDRNRSYDALGLTICYMWEGYCLLMLYNAVYWCLQCSLMCNILQWKWNRYFTLRHTFRDRLRLSTFHTWTLYLGREVNWWRVLCLCHRKPLVP